MRPLTDFGSILTAFSADLHVQRKEIRYGKTWRRVAKSFSAIDLDKFEYRVAPPSPFTRVWTNEYTDAHGTFRSGYFQHRDEAVGCINPGWKFNRVISVTSLRHEQ